MNRKYIKPIALLTIITSIFIALAVYQYLPSSIATHWNIYNQADGYSSKIFGLFFMPILSIFLYCLFIFLPTADPYKKNFKQFENHFDNFISVIFLFFFYIYILTLLWNLNYRFNMIQLLSPAMAVLFAFAGFLMSKTKRNWFVSIRTPWTISSPYVWKKTHALGAKLFYVSAIATFLSVFFPNIAIYLIMLPILISSIFLFIYSYFCFKNRKLAKKTV